MNKNKFGGNGIFSAFKIASLLTLILLSILFVYTYLQTGSFDIRPDAKLLDPDSATGGKSGRECYINKTCKVRYGNRFICTSAGKCKIDPTIILGKPQACLDVTSRTSQKPDISIFTCRGNERCNGGVEYKLHSKPVGMNCGDCDWATYGTGECVESSYTYINYLTCNNYVGDGCP